MRGIGCKLVAKLTLAERLMLCNSSTVVACKRFSVCGLEMEPANGLEPLTC